MMSAAYVQRRLERTGLVGVPLLTATYVALLAGARWPEYWAWIAPEQTPMTWLQSMLLVLCAVAALLMAASVRLRGRGRALSWVLLAAAFAYLALDERFALHERVRDSYLAPRGIEPPFLPWVAPGDFLLLGYAVVGLAMVPLVLRIFHGRARWLLVAGAALAVVAVVGDSFNVHTMSLTMEIGEQTAEEVVELASSTCLLLAMWLRLLPVLAPDDDNRAGAHPPAVLVSSTEMDPGH